MCVRAGVGDVDMFLWVGAGQVACKGGKHYLGAGLLSNSNLWSAASLQA